MGWRQHLDRGVLQLDAGQVERLELARDALHVAVHLRRLAEQHVHGHVHRRVVGAFDRADHQLPLFASPRRPPRTGSARARRRPRTAPAIPARSPARSAPGSRCTRSPWAPGRTPPAAPCAGRSARRGRRRWSARERRSTGRPRRRRGSPGSGSRRPAAQQWLMTSCARRSISGLPRCTESKSSSAALAPVAIELAAPPPMPMRMPGPAQLDQQRAGRELDLLRQAGVDGAQAAGDHDGLVIAAHDVAPTCLLVLAEVAQQVGPAEFVVEGGAAQRPLGHDLQRAGDVLRLAAAVRQPPHSFETVKPVRPALGLEPRPVAPSSRISPPAPVEAPGKGEIAVGWLCVSTFISTWCSASSLR